MLLQSESRKIMKLEVEITTLESSVLLGMLKNMLLVFAIENEIETPTDSYVRANLGAELSKLEDLGLVSYYKVSSVVNFENKKNTELKGE